MCSVGSKVRMLFHSGLEGIEMPQSFPVPPRNGLDFLLIVRGSMGFLLLSIGRKGGYDKLAFGRMEWLRVWGQ